MTDQYIAESTRGMAYPAADHSDDAQELPTPSEICIGDVLAERYRICSVLGRGSMGVVWLAHDDVLRRPVAIKHCLRAAGADVRRAMLAEARAASRVSHPNVVSVHDVGDDWFVMEALLGRPLSVLLREHGPIGQEQAANIASHVLSALRAVHAAGMVHRDVKPSNIQLGGPRRVVLTDFGLTSHPRQARSFLRGRVVGSIPYLAPEVLVDGRVGPEADLYALGVTLHAAVEGSQWPDPETPMSALRSVLGTSALPGPRSGPLAPVINGLTERDPDRRLGIDQAFRLLSRSGLIGQSSGAG